VTIIGAANESEIRVDANYVKQGAFSFTTQFRFSLDLVTARTNCRTFTVITSFTRGYCGDHWLALVLPICRAYLLLNRH